MLKDLFFGVFCMLTELESAVRFVWKIRGVKFQKQNGKWKALSHNAK